MFKLLTDKVKRIVGIIAIASFLCTPLTYAVEAASVSAAPRHEEQRQDAPPPEHDRDRDRDKDKDDDDGYSKGNIVSAVLIGGVIGAVIAKNT